MVRRTPGFSRVGIALRFLLPLAVVAAAAIGWLRPKPAEHPPVQVQRLDSPARINPELAARKAGIEALEQRINETVWAPEMLAQDCGRTVGTGPERLHGA